jgi:hypothetical protein
MGTISRHSGFPFADGETLSGTDLETDISRVFGEVNGNLDNANIDASANIDGSKLNDNSITNAKLVNDTLTPAKASAGLLGSAVVSTSTVDTAATSGASFVDVPDISPATIIPVSTNDLIFCSLTVTMRITAGTGTSVWAFGFNVDGVDSAEAGFLRLTGTPTEIAHTTTITYVVAAATAASQEVKPIYYRSNGSGSASFGHTTISDINRTFTCWVHPL